MGCLESFGRVVVIIFNIFIMIIGLPFLVGGLLIKFGLSLYRNALDTVEKRTEQAISATAGGTVDVNPNLGSMLEPVANSLIAVGVFVLVICFFACFGAYFRIKVLLILYIVLAIIIVAGEIVVITLFLGFQYVINTSIANSLKSEIQSEYEDLSGTSLVSQAWNLAMQQFQCCGADGYKDFIGASKWNTVKYGGTSSCTLTTPLACCKTLPSVSTSSDLVCASSPTTDNNNLNTGCVNKVWDDYIIGNKIAVRVVFSILALFRLEKRHWTAQTPVWIRQFDWTPEVHDR